MYYSWKMYYAIHRYAKAKNTYLNDHDKNNESLYITCWDVNRLYRWAMAMKVSLGGFK